MQSLAAVAQSSTRQRGQFRNAGGGAGRAHDDRNTGQDPPELPEHAPSMGVTAERRTHRRRRTDLASGSSNVVEMSLWYNQLLHADADTRTQSGSATGLTLTLLRARQRRGSCSRGSRRAARSTASQPRTVNSVHRPWSRCCRSRRRPSPDFLFSVSAKRVVWTGERA